MNYYSASVPRGLHIVRHRSFWDLYIGLSLCLIECLYSIRNYFVVELYNLWNETFMVLELEFCNILYGVGYRNFCQTIVGSVLLARYTIISLIFLWRLYN